MTLLDVRGTIVWKIRCDEALAANVIGTPQSLASNNEDASRLCVALGAACTWIGESHANVVAAGADAMVSAANILKKASTVQAERSSLSKGVQVLLQHAVSTTASSDNTEVKDAALPKVTVKDDNAGRAVSISALCRYDRKTEVVVWLKQVTEVSFPLRAVVPDLM